MPRLQQLPNILTLPQNGDSRRNLIVPHSSLPDQHGLYLSKPRTADLEVYDPITARRSIPQERSNAMLFINWLSLFEAEDCCPGPVLR